MALLLDDLIVWLHGWWVDGAAKNSIRSEANSYFFSFSLKTYVVVAHWKRLNETLPMCNHNIMFPIFVVVFSSYYRYLVL